MSIILFTLPLREGLHAIATEAGIVDLRLLTTEKALDLWAIGTPYLLITARGARHLLARSPIAHLVSMICMCKTPGEVRALRSVRPRSKALQEACTARMRAMRERVVLLPSG